MIELIENTLLTVLGIILTIVVGRYVNKWIAVHKMRRDPQIHIQAKFASMGEVGDSSPFLHHGVITKISYRKFGLGGRIWFTGICAATGKEISDSMSLLRFDSKRVLFQTDRKTTR